MSKMDDIDILRLIYAHEDTVLIQQRAQRDYDFDLRSARRDNLTFVAARDDRGRTGYEILVGLKLTLRLVAEIQRLTNPPEDDWVRCDCGRWLWDAETLTGLEEDQGYCSHCAPEDHGDDELANHYRDGEPAR